MPSSQRSHLSEKYNRFLAIVTTLALCANGKHELTCGNYDCEDKMNDKDWFSSCDIHNSDFRFSKRPWSESCIKDYVEVVQSCARNAQRNREGNISKCMNLAVAGTGSKSIANIIHAHNLTVCTHTPKGGCYQHSHTSFGMRDVMQRTSCAIITLRDPVARLESGYRYENRNKHGKHHKAKVIDEVLFEYRRPYEDGDDAPSERSPPKKYSLYLFTRPIFLYLSGLTRKLCDSGAFDLHVICTERLEQDTFGVAQLLHMNMGVVKHGISTHRRSDINTTSNSTLRADSLMSDDYSNFIRNDLMRADFELYKALCGTHRTLPIKEDKLSPDEDI